MTNYLVLVAAAAILCSGTCTAAEPPAPARGAARFVQAPGTGSLAFSFMQAGAENHGSFRQFATGLTYDPRNPTAGSLEVTVQMASFDTQDKDRDEILAGPDLFDTKKYPTAQYVAKTFANTNGKLEAVGKLTLRGVTKDLRIPLTLRVTGSDYELSGEVTLRRLDYGIGQGEYQSTEWVGNEVKLQYRVKLVRSK